MIALNDDFDRVAQRGNTDYFHFGAFNDAHFLKPLMKRTVPKKTLYDASVAGTQLIQCVHGCVTAVDRCARLHPLRAFGVVMRL